jgi:PKD repeat protein
MLASFPVLTEDAHMGQKKDEDSPGKTLFSWIKTGLTSLFGVVSGAALMYATTFVSKELAPQPPVANFECQASGLDVTIHNRSTNGHEGWWDFGDGTALIPFVPDQQTIEHKYAKAGSYNVKLALKNLLGEPNERTVSVVVDGTTPGAPSIDAFVVMPVNGDTYAPATFHATTRVKDASLCVWAVSDRPIEVHDPSDAEHVLTFKDPGQYTIKLAATNGKQTVEKVTTVEVHKAPLGAVAATVKVTYEAVIVESRVTKPVVQLQFRQAGTAFNQDFGPDPGFEFVHADFDPQMKFAGFLTPPSLQISADKKKLTVNGELRNQVPKNGTYSMPLVVTQQRVSPPTIRELKPMSVNLQVPGTTLVPLPELPQGWLATKRTLSLSVAQDGKGHTWEAGKLPQNEGLQFSSSALFMVSASEQANQLRIDLSEFKSAMSLLGN